MSGAPMIAPSLLSADFMHAGRDASILEEAGADWMHVDVMDGHFVPNITMGVPYLKCLREHTAMPIDAHLMVSNPTRQIPWFADAGADVISVHVEAYMDDDDAFDLERIVDDLDAMRAGGAKAAIAIKPKTALEPIAPLIPECDMVLVMSVEPGFSGQGFIEGSDSRVAEVRAIARERGAEPLIQVDGGIVPETASLMSRAGATVFVSGNYVLKADDPGAAIGAIRKAASRAMDGIF